MSLYFDQLKRVLLYVKRVAQLPRDARKDVGIRLRVRSSEVLSEIKLAVPNDEDVKEDSYPVGHFCASLLFLYYFSGSIVSPQG